MVERRERDQLLAEKRRQREEQMQVLLQLVEGVTHGPEKAENRRVSQGTFERLMSAHEIKKACWSFKLAPNLTGRAQQAYAALEANAARDYETLKAGILG